LWFRSRCNRLNNLCWFCLWRRLSGFWRCWCLSLYFLGRSLNLFSWRLTSFLSLFFLFNPWLTFLYFLILLDKDDHTKTVQGQTYETYRVNWILIEKHLDHIHCIEIICTLNRFRTSRFGHLNTSNF
jgi:hypothetical protein